MPFSLLSPVVNMHRVVVQEANFDVAEEVRRLGEVSRGVGAINTFVGLVRDNNESTQVDTLHLEHYAGMTEKQIEKIMLEAAERWEVLGATVIHRIGTLHPGEQIVFVGVSSPHRGDAFDACEFIIDYLKTRATFWKKEVSDAGANWLETRQSDIETANNWSTTSED